MDDKTDIGFINTHAEGICGCDNPAAVSHKVVLDFCPLLLFHSAVIGTGDSFAFKIVNKLC